MNQRHLPTNHAIAQTAVRGLSAVAAGTAGAAVLTAVGAIAGPAVATVGFMAGLVIGIAVGGRPCIKR